MSDATTTQPKERATARRLRPRVVAAYGVLFLIGAAFAVGGLGYRFVLEDGLIGPAAMPVVTGTLLALVAVLLVVQEATRGSVLEGDGIAAEEHADPAERHAVRRKLLAVVGSTVVAVAVMPWLGLLPSLTALVFVQTWLIERQVWWKALLSAAGAFAVAYLIFITVLNAPLPFGVFNPALWGIR